MIATAKAVTEFGLYHKGEARSGDPDGSRPFLEDISAPGKIEKYEPSRPGKSRLEPFAT